MLHISLFKNEKMPLSHTTQTTIRIKIMEEDIFEIIYINHSEKLGNESSLMCNFDHVKCVSMLQFNPSWKLIKNQALLVFYNLFLSI